MSQFYFDAASKTSVFYPKGRLSYRCLTALDASVYLRKIESHLSLFVQAEFLLDFFPYPQKEH